MSPYTAVLPPDAPVTPRHSRVEGRVCARVRSRHNRLAVTTGIAWRPASVKRHTQQLGCPKSSTLQCCRHGHTPSRRQPRRVVGLRPCPEWYRRQRCWTSFLLTTTALHLVGLHACLWVSHRPTRGAVRCTRVMSQRRRRCPRAFASAFMYLGQRRKSACEAAARAPAQGTPRSQALARGCDLVDLLDPPRGRRAVELQVWRC